MRFHLFATKTVIPCVLTILTSTNLPLAMAQQWTVQEQQLITTQGQGEIKVSPDSLQVFVTVESESSTLTSVRNEVNQKMQKVIQALKGLNLSQLQLKTQSLQFYPIYSNEEKVRARKIVGYHGTYQLLAQVLKTNPEQLGEQGTRIVDTALNAGANNVGDLQFYVADLANVRTQALKAAVIDAKHNAEAIAEGLGVQVTGVYSVEGLPQYNYAPMMYRKDMLSARAGTAEMSSTPVETGEMTVTSNATVRFKFAK